MVLQRWDEIFAICITVLVFVGIVSYFVVLWFERCRRRQKSLKSRVEDRKQSIRSNKSDKDISLEFKLYKGEDKSGESSHKSSASLSRAPIPRPEHTETVFDLEKLDFNQFNPFFNSKKGNKRSETKPENDIYIDLKEESVKSKRGTNLGKSSTPCSSVSTISGFHAKDLSLRMDDQMTDFKATPQKIRRALSETYLNVDSDNGERIDSKAEQTTNRLYETIEETNQMPQKSPEYEEMETDLTEVCAKTSKNFNFVGEEVLIETMDPLIAQQILNLDKSYDYLILSTRK